MAKESTFPTIKEEDKSFATSINKSSDQTNREQTIESEKYTSPDEDKRSKSSSSKHSDHSDEK